MTLREKQPSVPGAPTGVTATAGNASAGVSWTAPSSNGGSAITSYTVTPFIGSTAQTPVTVTGSPPATSTTVTGLTNGTTYTFTVSATPQRHRASLVTIQRRDPEHVHVPGAPTGVTATAGNGSATVSWTTVQQRRQRDHQLHGDALHRLDRADAGDGDRQPARHLDHGERADQRHQLHLHRVGHQRHGTGPASAPSNAVTPTASTVPGAPTGVTATAGNGSATVSWTARPNGGSALTSYTVTPYIGSSAQTPVTVTGTRRPPRPR